MNGGYWGRGGEIWDYAVSERACVVGSELSCKLSSLEITSRTDMVSSWPPVHPIFLNVFNATFASAFAVSRSPRISARLEFSSASSAIRRSGRTFLTRMHVHLRYLRALMWSFCSSQTRAKERKVAARSALFFKRYMIFAAAMRFSLAPSRSALLWYMLERFMWHSKTPTWSPPP